MDKDSSGKVAVSILSEEGRGVSREKTPDDTGDDNPMPPVQNFSKLEKQSQELAGEWSKAMDGAASDLQNFSNICNKPYHWFIDESDVVSEAVYERVRDIELKGGCLYLASTYRVLEGDK